MKKSLAVLNLRKKIEALESTMDSREIHMAHLMLADNSKHYSFIRAFGYMDAVYATMKLEGRAGELLKLLKQYVAKTATEKFELDLEKRIFITAQTLVKSQYLLDETQQAAHAASIYKGIQLLNEMTGDLELAADVINDVKTVEQMKKLGPLKLQEFYSKVMNGQSEVIENETDQALS